jgi:hypothetical protein
LDNHSIKTSKKVVNQYEEDVFKVVAHGWIDGKMKLLKKNEFSNGSLLRSNSL